MRINHVLSTVLLTSTIFDHLIARAAAAAPQGVQITRTYRPDRRADVRHYHRPNLERRLLPRSVVSIHHDLEDDREWLSLRHGLSRYREAAVVVCLNTRQRAVLAGHGIAQVDVVPHGVDRRIFPIPPRPRRFGGGCLRLGLFSRRYASGIKGEFGFAKLLAELDPRRVSFVLVGEQRGREAGIARAMGFTVDCWERLPYRLMADIYNNIDALLILSRYEGGPACLPEALGSGIPVICTPVGMCLDLVRDGGNGLVLTGCPGPDGRRIMALLDDDARGIAALNEGAFAGAGNVPSWDWVMAEWHRVYRRAAPCAE